MRSLLTFALLAAGCSTLPAPPPDDPPPVCRLVLDEPDAVEVVFTGKPAAPPARCDRPRSAPAAFDAAVTLPGGARVAWDLERRWLGQVVEVGTPGILVTYQDASGAELCRAWRGALLLERDDPADVVGAGFRLAFALSCEAPGRTDLTLAGAVEGLLTDGRTP